MAKFAVYRTDEKDTLLLDCQADLLADLPTRFIVPLVSEKLLAAVNSRLNPAFEIEGDRYVLAPQLAGTVASETLSDRIATLAAHEYVIGGAIDVLLGGV